MKLTKADVSAQTIENESDLALATFISESILFL